MRKTPLILCLFLITCLWVSSKDSTHFLEKGIIKKSKINNLTLLAYGSLSSLNSEYYPLSGYSFKLIGGLSLNLNLARDPTAGIPLGIIIYDTMFAKSFVYHWDTYRSIDEKPFIFPPSNQSRSILIIPYQISTANSKIFVRTEMEENGNKYKIKLKDNYPNPPDQLYNDLELTLTTKL